jgi:hypothetical protein
MRLSKREHEMAGNDEGLTLFGRSIAGIFKAAVLLTAAYMLSQSIDHVAQAVDHLADAQKSAVHQQVADSSVKAPTLIR